MGPHKQGDVVGGRYKISGFVGKGGMQFVYRASDQLLGRLVALKTPQNASAARRFRRSAVVSARINHPSIAKTLDFFESNGTEYLVEEFIEGSDLSTSAVVCAGFVDPYIGAHIFHSLVRGLMVSHEAGVVHRDLKPSNVMVGSDLAASTIKITDFGIAKMAEEELNEAVEHGESSITSSQTAVGALPYMAPEAIDTPKEVTFSADVWSCGAMMFELLSGQKPFGKGLRAVGAILSGKRVSVPPFLLANAQLKPLASALMELVDGCLVVKADKRLSAKELVERCGRLCYPISGRHIGQIGSFKYGAWGFISQDNRDVFYHKDSFYGPERPVVGDRVIFSKYEGKGAWRAHPVIKVDQGLLGDD